MQGIIIKNMLELRYYQREAVDSIFKYYQDGKIGNVLVTLPTATGKSLVIAEFIRRAISLYPSTRILVACHVKELVSQNHQEFFGLCPEIESGVHSAGLGKRDLRHRVLFCGIQSIWRKAFDVGKCDILMIDEAHTVPKEGEGMWLTFIEQLRLANPFLKVVGLSATPFRLDSGLLIEGKNRIFTDVCYDYPLLQAVKEGYVCQLVPKPLNTTYDISMVHKRGGEYIPGELEAAINIDEKTDSAINEVIALGQDRKKWLVFAAGNAHAQAICENMISKGISAVYVTQDTSRAERDKAVKDLRDGKIRCLINNLIFTTGFNIKDIDVIACFRPTQSAGLWVQMCGRGFRIHPDKSDCLLLDFGKNLDRHGPLDKITGSKRGEGEGDAPVKTCPECHAVCFAGCRNCPDCGYEFPDKPLDIDKTASTSAVLSTQEEAIWHPVLTVDYARHRKEGKPDSMVVTYSTYSGRFKEWVMFEHLGFPREKATRWHRARSKDKCPNTITEALLLKYPNISEVCVRKNGKFFDILGVKIDKSQIEANVPVIPVNIQVPEIKLEDLPDIPF